MGFQLSRAISLMPKLYSRWTKGTLTEDGQKFHRGICDLSGDEDA